MPQKAKGAKQEVMPLPAPLPDKKAF